MRLLNILSVFSDNLTKIKDFLTDIIAFLTSYLGSELMAYVTLGIIGVLALALITCFFIALFNPSKRKLKKLNKSLKRQNEYEALRQRLFQISEEIGTINLEIRIIERQYKDDVFNLEEVERSAVEQDDIFMSSRKYRLEDLAEKQAVLNEVLTKQKKGSKANRKEKAESTQLLINDLIAQQNECQNEISLKKAEIEQRKILHEKDLTNLKASCQAKCNELAVKKNALELEKIEISKKLTKLEKKDKHKLSVSDAEAMTDEFAKQRKLADQEVEDKALEELRIAKLNYEEACKKRAKAEKDKNVAVENVKALQKQKAKAKSTKSVDYSPVTKATAVISNDKPDDVNIIIADIDSGIVFNPTPIVEPAPEVEEHVYKEPTIEVVDFDHIPEEDVIFVEAFLDYLNVDADDETILDESAITEETAITFTPENNQAVEKIEQPIEETIEESVSTAEIELVEEEVLSAEEIASEEQVELDEVTPQIEEIEKDEPIVESSANEPIEEPIKKPTPEVVEIEKTETIVVKKTPAYKDYNDGIPATPIHKKSKFQKPITKLVKKAKPADTESQPIKKEADIKTGYNGKWSIEEKDGKHFAKLVASNGGVLLTTPSYSNVNGVKACIENLKQNLASDNVAICVDKEGKAFFKVLSSAGRTIAQSAKHSTKYQCEKSLASTKNFAQKAIIH